MSRRTRQVGDLLREELDEIIRHDVKDPRVGFFTITRVEVTPDIRQASAYISVLGTDDEREGTLAALYSASGYIRRQLKPRLRMRQIPEITFVDDRSMEYAQTISSALQELKSTDAVDRVRERELMDRGSWSIDEDVAKACLAQLKSASLICLPTHQNIDADGFGSALALSHALRRVDISSFVLISDGRLPDSLRFLPGSSQAVIYGQNDVPEYDLLCMVDCSDRNRLGDFVLDDPSRVEGRTPIVNIDHHITNDHFGIVNIVEPKAAATAEIITVLLDSWGIEKTVPVAQCLLAGIYGDTLGLRTESTTSRTMRMAADLVDSGANPTSITDALFRLKPASTVCLWRHALDGIGWTGSLIWTSVTREMLESCSADSSEAEGIVNFLAGTHGSRAAAILHENDRGWRVSMRSMTSDVDVAAIAAEFGGGGHPRAAGCQVTGGPAEREHFLQTVAERIGRKHVA